MRYFDPRYDITFKKVFSHPELLISFLNALLPLKDDEQVEGIEYLSPEMLPETPTNKFSVVDVCCKDRKNRQFIVEMQMVWSEELKSRVLLNEIQTLKP
jgi:predicted transposase/invertase (TIGR01784 family)